MEILFFGDQSRPAGCPCGRSGRRSRPVRRSEVGQPYTGSSRRSSHAPSPRSESLATVARSGGEPIVRRLLYRSSSNRDGQAERAETRQQQSVAGPVSTVQPHQRAKEGWPNGSALTSQPCITAGAAMSRDDRIPSSPRRRIPAVTDFCRCRYTGRRAVANLYVTPRPPRRARDLDLADPRSRRDRKGDSSVQSFRGRRTRVKGAFGS